MRLFLSVRPEVGAILARVALAAGLAAALGAAPGAAEATEPTATPVVVELFTSQACSFCPPADAMLGELAQRDDVIALTLNVDYWDFEGWKDRLARPENVERQRGYAAAFGVRVLSTPEIVVHGATSVKGANHAKVAGAIGAAPQPHARIKLSREGGALKIDIKSVAGDDAQLCRVLVIGYDGPHEFHMKSGGNSGKTVSYHNVVQEMQDLGTWAGADKTLTTTINENMSGYAVVLQAPGHGPILAAAKIDL